MKTQAFAVLFCLLASIFVPQIFPMRPAKMSAEELKTAAFICAGLAVAKCSRASK